MTRVGNHRSDRRLAHRADRQPGGGNPPGAVSAGPGAHAVADLLVRFWRAAYRGLLPDDVPPLVPADRADLTLGDLYALYLAPDVWRRGIGTRLHAAALERLRSCGFTHAGLWVLDTNEAALGFYRRHVWTDTGRSQLDRGPGDTELRERRLHRDLSD